MKNIRLLFVLLCLLCSLALPAQVNGERTITIIDKLQSGVDASHSTGVIQITTDPAITQLLGSPWNNSMASGDANYIKSSGFRVQVFSGNDPKRSKDEAFSKERRIQNAFPDMATYVSYRSPKWSLRVGDFRTKEEAVSFMQTLKQAFPEFAKEIYTVREEGVQIPVYNKDKPWN